MFYTKKTVDQMVTKKHKECLQQTSRGLEGLLSRFAILRGNIDHLTKEVEEWKKAIDMQCVELNEDFFE